MAKTTITFIRSESGDWEAAYRDDVLIQQTHSLDAATLLEAMGFDVTNAELPDDFEKTGDEAPDKLSDVFKAYPDLTTE